MTDRPDRILNAAATLTRLGGSVMAEETVAAMAEAARHYVDLPARYRTVGDEIAALTRNEAAAVTSGAAAALTLLTAVALYDAAAPREDDFPLPAHAVRREVLMLAPQRNDYDAAIRILGAQIRESSADPQSVAALLGPQTACVLWFAGTQYPAPGIELRELVHLAHERGIPVIVDAAAQVPPVSSLWHYTTELGADAAVFSGGKGLRGPQTGGLVVGSRRLVDGVLARASPNHGIGRLLKVGKEELAGMLSAVRLAVQTDDEETIASYDDIARTWVEQLGPVAAVGARVRTDFPSEAGQPHLRTLVTLAGPDAQTLCDRLWERSPRVAVLVTADDTIALNPQPLLPGEANAVGAAVLAEVLSR